MIKELGGCLLWVRNCLALNNSFETLLKILKPFYLKNVKQNYFVRLDLPKKKLFERREANPNPWIKNTAQGEMAPYIARIHFNPIGLGPIAS